MNKLENMMISIQELHTTSPSDSPIKFICEACGDIFDVPKYRVLTTLKGKSSNTLKYCSASCLNFNNKKSSTVHCKNCGKLFEKKASEISKSPNHFCSRSCAAINRNQNKTTGVRRSAAEEYLVQLIRQDFPGINIDTNNRQLLNGLEIDILLPGIKIAIELNGPVHYYPIYGASNFERTRNADTRKTSRLHELGYGLITIDISQQKQGKKSREFLLAHYESTIKRILVEASR